MDDYTPIIAVLHRGFLLLKGSDATRPKIANTFLKLTLFNADHISPKAPAVQLCYYRIQTTVRSYFLTERHMIMNTSRSKCPLFEKLDTSMRALLVELERRSIPNLEVGNVAMTVVRNAPQLPVYSPQEVFGP